MGDSYVLNLYFKKKIPKLGPTFQKPINQIGIENYPLYSEPGGFSQPPGLTGDHLVQENPSEALGRRSGQKDGVVTRWLGDKSKTQPPAPKPPVEAVLRPPEGAQAPCELVLFHYVACCRAGGRPSSPRCRPVPHSHPALSQRSPSRPTSLHRAPPLYIPAALGVLVPPTCPEAR